MANPSPRPKYTIKTDYPNNKRMFTHTQILNGDGIVGEWPLDQILIGLEDTYNPDEVVNILSKFNASRHFNIQRERMSDHDRVAFDNLYKKDANGGLVSTSATNAFQFEVHRDGQSFTYLAVFNDISRANHSCLPNAVWTWDAERGMGTLHAIKPIEIGTDLTIEYLANPAQSLRSGLQRNKDFKKFYNFECPCTACCVKPKGQEKHRNRSDDQLRGKARTRWERIKNYVPTANQSAAEAALAKLRLAQKHRDMLEQLEINDMKLADAYMHLSTFHEDIFDNTTTQSHAQVCDWSGEEHDRTEHLERALRYSDQENRIHINCVGTVHPDLVEDDSRKRAINTKINRYM